MRRRAGTGMVASGSLPAAASGYNPPHDFTVHGGPDAHFNLSAVHPATGRVVTPASLLSVAGLHRIMTELVTNFTNFAPLGTVLVAMLGIAVGGLK